MAVICGPSWLKWPNSFSPPSAVANEDTAG
jgi:hypothetical protein